MVPIDNRKYIFKWSIFHGYATLPECKYGQYLGCADGDEQSWAVVMTIFPILNFWSIHEHRGGGSHQPVLFSQQEIDPA